MAAMLRLWPLCGGYCQTPIDEVSTLDTADVTFEASTLFLEAKCAVLTLASFATSLCLHTEACFSFNLCCLKLVPLSLVKVLMSPTVVLLSGSLQLKSYLS